MKVKKQKTQTNLEPDNKAEDLNITIASLSDKLARALADYSNLEKRVDSQRQMFANIATAGMLNKLVPVLDDLYLAQSHLKDSGLQITIDKLKQLIKSEGIDEINPKEGDEFDSETMSCISVVDGEDNKIKILHKIGYKLNDQVLRPAEVVVGKTIVTN